ncbi:type II secretion system secretin GspD [Gallaecimonas sp. GXIMD4217]|uniref:type II secretion system secretin GspD n=1 Tax=Gallaecimonas sp. GXIMD4217 TaxID=3131927 RepID=UPI00311AFBA4
MAIKQQHRRTLASVLLTALLSGAPVLAAYSGGALAEEPTYNAQFKDTDISEFIATVSSILKRTIVLDPSVRGKIDVRSYKEMTAAEYYDYFQNVLDVYGFAVVEMPNGVLKVVKAKDAKTGPSPVLDAKEKSTSSDQVVTRVVQVHNVPVRELAPILRQLNDNAGAGNVVHYDDSNILILTGRAATVDRLEQIVRRADKAGDQDVQVVKLQHASAAQVVAIVEDLNKGTGNKPGSDPLAVKVVADERTNSVLVSGEAKGRARVIRTIRALDSEQQTTGNTRVIYLQYAKAEDLVEVLEGVSETIVAEEQQGQQQARSRSAQSVPISIKAHEDTNALVITAQPDLMRSLEGVIKQLDIRRAQVHVEAIIVEIFDGDGTDLGVQWVHEDYGLQQFNNGNFPSLTQVGAAALAAEGQKGTTTVTIDSNGTRTEQSTPDTRGDFTLLAQVLGQVNGAMWGVLKNDWGAIVQAVSTNTKANILSTPSVTTLDNKEANFVAGEDVPLLTGSTPGENNSNPFQTIERQQLGVKLKVTPQINEGDSVQLEIVQEVSSRAGNTAVDITLNKREVSTTVLVGDGDTVVLGGLIDEDVQESESKVPLLGDIPVLGHLFKSTSTSKRKRNLMVFIRPSIVRDRETMSRLSHRKYNFMRDGQLQRQEDGISLMPFMEPPVLPQWDDALAHPPSFEEYLQRQAREGSDD